MSINYEELTRIALKNNFIIIAEDIDKMNETEFKEIRQLGFGASDSSKLLNVNPFPNGTTLDLIDEKVRGVFDETISKKASVRMGKELESLILLKTQSVLKVYIHKPTSMFGNLQYHLNINFDGVGFFGLGKDLDARAIEAKLVTEYGRKYYNFQMAYKRTLDGEVQDSTIEPNKPDFTNEENMQTRIKKYADFYGIPVYYLTQLQQQIFSLGNDFGFLTVLDVKTWDIFVFKVYAHEDIIEYLKSSASENWAIIEARRSIQNKNMNSPVSW